MTTGRSGYPFAEQLLGGAASPLWRLDPDALAALEAADLDALAMRADRLLASLQYAAAERRLLSLDRLDHLDAGLRRRLRHLWWRYLDALLAVDHLKQRYAGWYGVDYFRHPRLHARAFGLCFAALCAELTTGAGMLELVAGHGVAQALFDEEMPEVGLPRGTFQALRSRVAGARDHSYVVLGTAWYDRWIEEHLRADDDGRRVAALVATWRDRAFSGLGAAHVGASVLNALEAARDAVFAAWFPLQKDAAEWLGDTRMVAESRRLVSDAQLAECARRLRPGDILLARRNWYLSNVGLPGFWPHAALFVGSPDQLAVLGVDPGVREAFGDLLGTLSRRHPRAMAELGAPDAEGHRRCVIEAVGEGVTLSSVEHACGADYVAALRPRLAPVDVAAALDRALGFHGRPYDFAFDFATDDALVCSELVLKAYEPSRDGRSVGLRVPFVEVAGRTVQPPTEIARTFAVERGGPRDAQQLDHVLFFDGREGEGRAVEADAEALAASAARPKWDFLLP